MILWIYDFNGPLTVLSSNKKILGDGRGGGGDGQMTFGESIQGLHFNTTWKLTFKHNAAYYHAFISSVKETHVWWESDQTHSLFLSNRLINAEVCTFLSHLFHLHFPKFIDVFFSWLFFFFVLFFVFWKNFSFPFVLSSFFFSVIPYVVISLVIIVIAGCNLVDFVASFRK